MSEFRYQELKEKATVETRTNQHAKAAETWTKAAKVADRLTWVIARDYCNKQAKACATRAGEENTDEIA